MDSSKQTPRVRPRSDSTPLEQEPPPQRRRCEVTVKGSDPEGPESTPAPRDEKYYRPDGDCIIRVENTLFKIHRYHLSEDSSIFRSMFGLPAGTTPSEGQNDRNPIVLSGDTPTQFRAFLSFSYSNPNQLQINRMSVADVERIVNMVPFAHKYLLNECLLWALESLERVLIHSAALVPADQYSMILEATSLCTSLHAPICDRICGLLKRQWVAHIQSNSLAVGPALDIADRFNLRSFLVELYCIVLDKLANTPELEAVAAADGPLAGISSTHKLRIFSGSWALSRCWSDFSKKDPPHLSAHLTCTNARYCAELWKYNWAGHMKTIRNDTAGKGNPEELFRQLDRFKSAMNQNMGGRCLGNTEIDNAIAGFKSSLSNHFFCAST
ncbi:hypothetical protein FB451DRAFT_1246439 [Mycena latifolia]|nr:hypothetical protein FB451DRAFT_1246439 [Mycena latifolia]